MARSLEIAMGLLDQLGLPKAPNVAGGSTAPPAPAPAPSTDDSPQATAILFNASPVPLRLTRFATSNRSEWRKEAPGELAPNARGTANVRHADDLEMTWGELEYHGGEGTAQTQVTFSWKGRAGEIAATGPGKYATASRYRERNAKHREYLLVFKDTSKVKGPLFDALDADVDRIQDELDREQGGKTDGGKTEPPAAATPEFAGICKITVVNNADTTLVRGSMHLDNDQAHFTVEPPSAVPAGRSVPFVVHSRDPQHPEIGGFVNYTFRIDPPPAENPSGEFTLNLAWSGTTSGSNVTPHAKGIDVVSGGKPRQFVFTLSGPAIQFTPPKATSQPTLRKGDKSPDGWVEYLQQLLNMHIDAGLDVDGDFGKDTLAAVKKFQRMLKKEKDPEVLEDGVVGDETWSYLREGAPAKPATDKRKPHTYVEHGPEARWQTEKTLLVYHVDRDMLTLSAYSVGDTDQIGGRTARVRITGPDKSQKVADALIGKGEKSSKTGQGFEHLVTIESVSDLFGGGGRLPNGVYSVEAYFPADLGGDHCTSTLDFEAAVGEIDMGAG
jgi:hypothetical protein